MTSLDLETVVDTITTLNAPPLAENKFSKTVFITAPT